MGTHRKVEIEGKYRICGKEEENKVHIREL